MGNIIVFSIYELKLAIRLEFVERVINIVDIQELPNKFNHIEGIINYKGNPIPVVDMREVFQLPERATELSDMLIIVNILSSKLALHVDEVNLVSPLLPDQITLTQELFIDNEKIEGIILLNEEQILINDIEKFVDIKSITQIKEYMKQMQISIQPI